MLKSYEDVTNFSVGTTQYFARSMENPLTDHKTKQYNRLHNEDVALNTAKERLVRPGQVVFTFHDSGHYSTVILWRQNHLSSRQHLHQTITKTGESWYDCRAIWGRSKHSRQNYGNLYLAYILPSSIIGTASRVSVHYTHQQQATICTATGTSIQVPNHSGSHPMDKANRCQSSLRSCS